MLGHRWPTSPNASDVFPYVQTTRLLLLQFQHDIWDLDVFWLNVLDRHLEDHVLLVVWDWLLADRLYELAQSDNRWLVTSIPFGVLT